MVTTSVVCETADMVPSLPDTVCRFAIIDDNPSVASASF